MSADTAPITDAQVIDEEPGAVLEPRPRGADPVAPQSTALAVRERRSEVIRPLDPDALVEAFQTYQDLLPKLLTEADYQSTGDERFVKKSGWLKIAAAFDLDVQILRSTVERDFAGTAERAEVWARAISPSGRAMDGDGYCDITEQRFNRNRGKLENDLRTTATTRAMKRAISGLIGMGDPDDQPAPAAIAPASDELRQATRAVLGYLLDGDVTAADQLIERLVAYFDDQFPAIAGQAICLVVDAVKTHREAIAAEAAV